MQLPAAFGKYTLLKRLSTGAVVDIFKASTRTGDGQDLALIIKRIRPELAEEGRFALQFAEEARQMSLLQHENIAKVYEWGKHENALFVAMEYIKGTNLQSLVELHQQQGKRFPPTIALYIVAEVLKGLDYAHDMKDAFGNRQSVVHRDVCPANILISADGLVKLVDFGLAKATVEVQATRPDVLGGKYRTMAPEVLRGEQVTPQADLYSIGVLLYELITGAPIQAPQNMQAAESVALAIQQRPASHLQPDVPAELDALILRSIHPDPAARHASAMDLRTEVLTFLNRWDRGLNAASVVAFLREAVLGEASGPSVKPSFAFGEATSHWFARGDEVRKVEPGVEMEAPRKSKKAKASFAEGSTVMAVEESGLGKGRHLKAWALVGGILAVVAAVILVVVNLGERPVVKQAEEPDPDQLDVADGTYAGPVQLKSQPNQVVIFVDGDMVELKGQPPRLMGLRAGKRRFKLLAPGYLPWEGDVALAADKPFVLEKALEERKGPVLIQSKPSKALVFLDGKRVGKTPLTLPELSAAKTYKVRIKARRYERLEFEIAPGDWPESVQDTLVLDKQLIKAKKKRRRRRRRRR